ncbi:hypothetical protein BU16DRAFT_622951 [Lophium mytilinum]|uniref:Zn(2)-C6 fungal-type domain-containing protein n=1 Tax=Lophium mytilinum TaxID=390894 RepID=A0A6A6QBJ8_9PEZI|nr:hypothetical protein BU16DRAFT_622951 [Lophium mytilinum]
MPTRLKKQSKIAQTMDSVSSKIGGLACALCGKGFEKESSYKRHGYYCRSKQTGNPNSRKRSCTSCVRAKTRCDAQVPRCSKCEHSGIKCRYDKVTKRGSPASDSDILSTRSNSDSIATSQASKSPQALLVNKEEMLDGFMQLEDDGMSIDLAKWAPQIDPGFSIDMTFPNISEIFQPSVNDCIPPEGCIYLADPESLPFRPIVRRKMARSGSEMSSQFLIRIIRSYPEMMLRRETFPPFIHPQYRTSSGDIPETLANCMSVAQMFTTRTKESKNFMWRAIQMERDRVLTNLHQFDDRELWAGIQVFLIYTIMMEIDGELEKWSIHVPLLPAFKAISDAIGAQAFGDVTYDNPAANIAQSAPSPSVDEEQIWQDWLFEESKRRTHVLFKIIMMLIDIEGGLHCPRPSPVPEFMLAPLPCKKALWECRTSHEWRVEIDRSVQEREIFGLTETGELMVLREGYDGLKKSSASWEKWFAGVDGFGTLVMLTSGLL